MSTRTKKELEEKKAAAAASDNNNVQGVEDTTQNVQAETVKKKKRRGISNETRGSSRLKFDEIRDAKANGLFKGHLDSIEVTWITLGADVQGLQSFAGLAIPILTLTFASNEPQESIRKYVTHRMMPVESNALTIPGGDEAWKVESILTWIKHLMDVFVLKGRAMTEEEEDALCLSFDDTDDDGNYVPVEPEEVINGWKVLFENFIKIMNNEGKPVYKTVNGGILPIWMKLLRYTKFKNAWIPVVRGKSTVGDLGFTNFVGEGCIELYKQEAAPLLKIDVSKESIIHRQTAKPSVPAAPAASMMGGATPMSQMPGIGVPNDNAQFASNPAIFNGGNPADDLPF